MTIYHAPVDDYAFIFNELLRVQEKTHLPGYADLTPEFCRLFLEGAARIHEDVLFPVGERGDAEGARLIDGRVVTPKGYGEAFDAYRRGGWLSLSLPPEIGGSGLPPLLASAVGEMRAATAHSLQMYFGFCISVARLLTEVGEPWMLRHVAPRLAAGDWTATMCLTESHCGTDLRQIRTKATPRADGSWSIEGTKIFISGGDHDLAENIVHIVLAKVPDGDGKIANDLSSVNVFLVPKRTLDPDTGACTTPNDVHVDSIEHKMGIEGNATCVLRFAGSQGWRLGAASGAAGSAANMAPMFMLMNYARVGVALSGVAYAEKAVQNATAYARERVVARVPGKAATERDRGDPLIAHPDIRRLLLGARAFADGARATAMRALVWQQEAESGVDGDVRKDARSLMELMTPVMKAYFTDKAFEVVNDCLQVLGGHGYTRDYGLEQMVRSARILQVYEGANGIQAIDLVQRKLPARNWHAAVTFVAELRRAAAGPCADADSLHRSSGLKAAADHLEAVFDLLAARARGDAGGDTTGDAKIANLPTAYDVMEMCGIAAVGWTLHLAAACLAAGATRLPASVVRLKQASASHWFEREMPKLSFLRGRVLAGATHLLTLDDSDLG